MAAFSRVGGKLGFALALFILGDAWSPAYAGLPVKLRPRRVRPGDMFRVQLLMETQTASVATAEFMGHRFVLTGLSKKMARKGKARRFVGYVGVPVEAEAGKYPVSVQAAGFESVASIVVRDRTWKESSLTVKPRFTSTKRSEALVARLRKERLAVAELWSKEPSYQSLPRRLCRPLSRIRVTGVFGTKRVFNGLLQSRHYGTDYRGRVGVPVRSVMDGEVVLSANHFVTGGTVIVDHGRGLHSLYFHLSKRRVKLGQRVGCGELLGRVGQSGRVTGPHLHLSFVVQAQTIGGEEPWGMYVEPQQVLAGRWGQLQVQKAKSKGKKRASL